MAWIVLVVSGALILILLRAVGITRNVAIAAGTIFLFRAAPEVGQGYTYWAIDRLGFDQQFLGVLAQVGAVLALLDDFRSHDSAGYKRRADLGAGTLANNEDFCEFDLCTSFAVQLFDLDDVICSNLVLLSAGLDDCEHFLSFHVLTTSMKHECLVAGGLFVQSVGLKRSGPRR